MGHHDGFDKEWLKMIAEAKRAGLSIGEVKQFIEDHKRKAVVSLPSK